MDTEKSCCGGFSEEERNEIRRLVAKENAALLKRPQYLIGTILISAILLYLLVRGMGVEHLSKPTTSQFIISALGALIAAGVYFMVQVKFSKVHYRLVIWSVSFFAIWMFVFFLFLHRPVSTYNWIYILYAATIFIGWICCYNSAIRYFCEKLLVSSKKT